MSNEAQGSKMQDSTAATWRNLPAQPAVKTSAGVCGMHGVFVGQFCPKCVTGVKPNV